MAFGMVVRIAEKLRPSTSREEFEDDQLMSKREALANGIGVTGPPLPLDDLLSESDFLSLHIPLTADTKSIIGERELAAMKSSAVVVNAARGGVVDESGVF